METVSSDIKQLSDKYHIKAPSTITSVYSADDIQSLHRDAIARIERLMQSRRSNKEHCEAIMRDVNRHHYKHVPMWESPTTGSVIRYINPRAQHLALSPPAYVEDATATFITLRLKQRARTIWKIPRYYFVLQQISTPIEQVAVRLLKR